VESTLNSIIAFAKKNSGRDVHSHIEQLSKSSNKARTVVDEICQKYCRNCLTSNRGAIKHSLAECREAGNKPVTGCKKCLANGKPNEMHWMKDCKIFV
jgi:hypothetical protein